MNGTLLQKPSARRVIGMVVGIVIIGLGIALFKQSHLGNDSISALNMRLAELFGISLGVQNIAANLLMFAIEIWVGRQYIGLGTFVNGICIGFIVTAFYDPIAAFFGPAASLPEQLLWVAAAVIVTALGASLYQTADLGIAPYDALALELARKGLVTDQMVLTVGYDRESLTDPSCPPYHGPVTVDHYGRRVPKAAHGSETLRAPTASSRELLQALTVLFDRIVDRGLLVRRMYVVANHVQRERDVQAEPEYVQLDLFADEAALTARREEQSARARERRMQDAVLAIREKYGKNAILKAMSLRDGATARQRNEQIGGHKA